MSNVLLDPFPLWTIFLGGFLTILAALEAGYKLGHWRHRRAADEKEAPVGAMVGSILGLLAFMLGFTFSLAAARFESRRQTVLEEANAIGTTYLRAQLLPQPQGDDVAKLLREYVVFRIRGAEEQEEDVAAAAAKTEQLHELLWAQATAAAEKNPSSILTGLFIQSLNETIDLHAKRVLVGIRSRIPVVIWGGLFLLAMLGLASVGYQSGLSATRRSPAMLGLALAFAGVMALIADLDRGQEGLLRVSQQALVDVQKSMEPK